MASRAKERTDGSGSSGSRAKTGSSAAASAASKAGSRTAAVTAATKVATPWGGATVVEEVKVAQRAGDKRFASILQLLRTPAGDSLVRIAYTTDGVARRGPVTLRPKDLERLRAALVPGSELAEIVGWPGGDA